MAVLVAGLVLFLGIHLLPTLPSTRDSLHKTLGPKGYKGIFSLISLAGFVLIIWGYGLARLEPTLIFTPPVWGKSITYLLMLPVFILLIAAELPGRMAAAVKHPMVTAIKFWALAHLISNGLLADLLLFGGFLAYGVIDRISLKKRGSAGANAGPNALRNDIIAVVGGLAGYVIFMLWLHPMLIGVPVK